MTTPGPLMMTAQSRRTPALEKEPFFLQCIALFFWYTPRKHAFILKPSCLYERCYWEVSTSEHDAHHKIGVSNPLRSTTAVGDDSFHPVRAGENEQPLGLSTI